MKKIFRHIEVITPRDRIQEVRSRLPVVVQKQFDVVLERDPRKSTFVEATDKYKFYLMAFTNEVIVRVTLHGTLKMSAEDVLGFRNRHMEDVHPSIKVRPVLLADKGRKILQTVIDARVDAGEEWLDLVD